MYDNQKRTIEMIKNNISPASLGGLFINAIANNTTIINIICTSAPNCNDSNLTLLVISSSTFSFENAKAYIPKRKDINEGIPTRALKFIKSLIPRVVTRLETYPNCISSQAINPNGAASAPNILNRCGSRDNIVVHFKCKVNLTLFNMQGEGFIIDGLQIILTLKYAINCMMLYSSTQY